VGCRRLGGDDQAVLVVEIDQVMALPPAVAVVFVREFNDVERGLGLLVHGITVMPKPVSRA